MAEEKNFKLEVVTPEGSVFSGDVEYVAVPGSEGEFGVLAGHEEFLTTLKPGEVMYRNDSGEHWMAVSWGYAEVTGESMTVLADNAERAEKIDKARAESDLERWKAELVKEGLSEEDQDKFGARMAKAEARLAAVSHLD